MRRFSIFSPCHLLIPLLSALTVVTAFGGPVSLFDGQSLDHWQTDGKWWRVQDGLITGGSSEQKVPYNDFLVSKKSYANFELRLLIKVTGVPGTGMINSGVQIRSVSVPNSHEMSGYQVDAGEGWWGKLYDESRRNKVIAEPVDAKARDAAVKKDDWNEYRIRAEGPRIRSWINGVPALDYTEADANVPLDGAIGIQVHSGGKATVQVKDIAIEELPPTPDAPTWKSLGGYEAVRAKFKPAGKAATPPAKIKEGNASGTLPKTPEEQRSCLKLPEGFEIELIAAEDEAMGVGKFVPITFDARGALWTTTALEYPVDGNENPAAADALYASKAKDKVLVYDRDAASPTGYAKKPRIFAEGLAIPLGVLPYADGCYVQHGHDVALLRDTDGDGKADKREVILTGFGVQDSHLFPHQFMRAPGGWLWLAQGAFNYSKVLQPGQPAEKAVQFDQTRMARFRPDGSGFTITSNGPCNIWGLVLNGLGEAFIQEANDFGYPVMPFHDYANYPGCSDRQWKSYAPEFPGTGRDFRMGGTGLSGLALTDADGAFPEPWADVMLIANPITNRINAVKMHRDGPRWRMEKLADFVESSDPWFRPVALSMGPDGCVYIVDWYNRIISHNEVPRNHPDRDKVRGRIWRIKSKTVAPKSVPDFTTLSAEGLVERLGVSPIAASHLAWQTIIDRNLRDVIPNLKALGANPSLPATRRIAALWALEGLSALDAPLLGVFIKDADRNVRREAVRAIGNAMALALAPETLVSLQSLVADPDPEVRATVIRTASAIMQFSTEAGQTAQAQKALALMLRFALPALAEPVAPSTRNNKPIKVAAAYEREFERYTVRLLLESQPALVAEFLRTPEAAQFDVEARLLASLALEPKVSAGIVATILPQLQRAPGQEEVLRLAQYPEEAGVGDALAAILRAPHTGRAALEILLQQKTRLDAGRLAPILSPVAQQLLASADDASAELGASLSSSFEIQGAEPVLSAILDATPQRSSAVTVAALRALAALGKGNVERLATLAGATQDVLVRDEAVSALAASKAPQAADRLLHLLPTFTPAQRRATLEKLVSKKTGAAAMVTAFNNGRIGKDDLDPAVLDRLQAVLGADDTALKPLMDTLGAFFRPVLTLDGSEQAWTQTQVTLDGPCTIEAWVRLEPKNGKISNADGIAGSPGELDINFFGGLVRVYDFPPKGDVAVASKPMTSGLWTHIAATRNAAGIWKIYIDGELNATGNKTTTRKLQNIRLGWTSAPGGLNGALAEVRMWNVERDAEQIRSASDRSLPAKTPGLVFTTAEGQWGEFKPGAKIIRTSDAPPILAPEDALALDARYVRYRELAAKPGDATKGQAVGMMCQTCHLMGAKGGNIGPNLSGVGAMGTEAILRNILQPNAAMENGYRIFRLELKSGDLLDALFVSEDKDAVIIRIPGGEDRRIARKDIHSTKFLRRSLMPEGLLEAFTPEQISDLFAYLRTLK